MWAVWKIRIIGNANTIELKPDSPMSISFDKEYEFSGGLADCILRAESEVSMSYCECSIEITKLEVEKIGKYRL